MTKAEVGKLYNVEIQDCCVDVQFTARLIKIDESEAPEYPTYVWDNGVRSEGGFHLSEIEE